jgi:uncharacterized membrane protein
MATRHSARGVDRLVNFSDATVAIAITLLVLPLVEIAGEFGGDVAPSTVLRENSSAFLAFGITFVVIARFWVSHHRVFEWVGDYSTGLVWANFLWLAGIVLLPFAANALAAVHTTQRPVAYAIYIGTLLLACAALSVVEVILRRHPELVRDRDASDIDLTGGLVTVGVMLVALVVAVTVPAVGLYALLLLVLSGPATRLVGRARRSPARA